MGGNSISIYLGRTQLWVLQHYVQDLINQDLSMRDFFLMSVNIDRKGLWEQSDLSKAILCSSKSSLRVSCCAVLCLVAHPYPTLKPQRACQASPSLGILQARMLDWVAILSRGSSQPRDWTQVSHIVGRLFTIWATREAQEYRSGWPIPSPVDLANPGVARSIQNCLLVVVVQCSWWNNPNSANSYM